MADLIQMGATVATVVCPLGPRIRSFVGRKDSAKPAKDSLLPNVFAPADDLIALFERKTIRPHGLTALVGAHTTSQQRFVDTTRALDPQDSTPGVWDIRFYAETLNPNAPSNIFKFAADVKFSTHPRMADEWAKFASPKDGQDHWNDVSLRPSNVAVRRLTCAGLRKGIPSSLSSRSFQHQQLDRVQQGITQKDHLCSLIPAALLLARCYGSSNKTSVSLEDWVGFSSLCLPRRYEEFSCHIPKKQN
jgi:hypothetical protein